MFLHLLCLAQETSFLFQNTKQPRQECETDTPSYWQQGKLTNFKTGKYRCVYWSSSCVFCVLLNFILSKGPCNLHLNVKEGNKGRKMWLVFQFNVKRKNQEPVKKTINCQEKFPQFPIPSSCLLANGELGYFRFSRFLPQSHFLREKISSTSSFLLSVELRFDGKQRQEWDLLLWHLDPTLQLSGAGPSAKWDTTRPDPGWQKIPLLVTVTC